MELNRRQFLWVALAAVSAVAAGSWRLASRVVSLPVVRAAVGRGYPGRVAPLREGDLARPGPWAG